MKKLLAGLFLGIIGIIIVLSGKSVNIVDQNQNQYTNPYCAIDPSSIIVPFFDPCPEGSHVDRLCAAKCGSQYRNAVNKIYRNACIEFNELYSEALIAMSEAYEKQQACIASGQLVTICNEALSITIVNIDKQFSKDSKELQDRVSRDLDDVLGYYYDCLFFCPCLEN